MNPHYQYFLATGATPLQGKGDDIISPPPPPPPPPTEQLPQRPAPSTSPATIGKNPPTSPTRPLEPPTTQVETNIYTTPTAPIEDVLEDIDSSNAPSGGGGGGIGGGGQDEGQAPPPTKTWLPLILVAAGVFVLIRKTKK